MLKQDLFVVDVFVRDFPLFNCFARILIDWMLILNPISFDGNSGSCVLNKEKRWLSCCPPDPILVRCDAEGAVVRTSRWLVLADSKTQG